MRGDDFYSVRELRRRRLLGCAAFAGLLLVAYAVNGFETRPIWTLFENREGTFAAGDPYGEWIYGVCDGEEQQITVLRDGRLEGVAGLDSLRNVRFPDWCSSLPTVDNPDLDEWQSRLDALNALAARSATAAPILEAAEAMPVSTLYLKPVAEWIRDEEHAVDFLDTLATRPMRFDHENGAIERIRRENFSDLISDALDTARNSDLTPVQIERWLTSTQITRSGDGVFNLASLGDVGPEARAAVLQQLDDVRPDRRTAVFLSLAPDLVSRGGYGPLVRDKLRLLPMRDRLTAAQQLLAVSDGNSEFPIAMLATLRRGFGNHDSGLEAFTAIASKIRERPDAPQLLTRQLDDLAPAQRREAALYLVSLDRPGETTFTMSALGAFGDLHPASRTKFIYALMQSPQFEDRSVQEAALLAIRLQMHGNGRQELLGALARHPGIDADLRSRIRAEIGTPDRSFPADA